MSQRPHYRLGREGLAEPRLSGQTRQGKSCIVRRARHVEERQVNKTGQCQLMVISPGPVTNACTTELSPPWLRFRYSLNQKLRSFGRSHERLVGRHCIGQSNNRTTNRSREHRRETDYVANSWLQFCRRNCQFICMPWNSHQTLSV